MQSKVLRTKDELGEGGLKMKRIIALTLSVSMAAAASGGGYKVDYDGGSLPGLKSGADIKLFIEEGKLVVIGKNTTTNIPAASIKEISYGQDVHRRVGAAIGLAVISFGIGALMALTKSKKHYIGLTWENPEKKGGFAFQADKGEYRGILAGLEGISGKKAVNTDAMSVKN